MDLRNVLYSCVTCFSTPPFAFNGRRLVKDKLLGEGGFSYVYLVHDENTQAQMALKVIRCPFGAESVANAMREVDACKLFKHAKYIVHYIDFAVKQEAEGTKTVYILLPYYSMGNLQDLINLNVINDRFMPESDVVHYLKAICEALQSMHKYRSPVVRGDQSASRRSSVDANESALPLLAGEEQEALEDAVSLGELVPYAHRDIKPANIMLTSERTVVLIDMGSCAKARFSTETRQQALELQDFAAEHCTLPYRAPELFNIKIGSFFDEKVDLWSLGCTIYALMYSKSPFEKQEQDSGANLNMAIGNGRYEFPKTPPYSDCLKGIVSRCLMVNPVERPSVDDILMLLQSKNLA